MLHLNISGITFITVKVLISVVLSMTLVKPQAIHLLKTSVIVDKYKMHIKNNIKLETKNVLIDEKNYKDLAIYFNRYDRSKLIKILSLYFHELIGKIEKMKENIFDG